MTPITINGISFDPNEQAPALRAAGLESAGASKSDYILVQASTPLSPQQKDELTHLGVVIHEYVSENTYLCGYKGSDLGQIRALPFVAWANTYLQGFKVSPGLRPASMGPASHILPLSVVVSHSRAPRTVDVMFHQDVDPNDDAVRSAVAAAAHVDKTGLAAGRHKVRLNVEERFLDDLAAIDAVRVIQEVPARKLYNDVGRGH